MQGLQKLIKHLEHGRNIHISVLDLGGMLELESTKIEFCNIIHSKRFCAIAKSTQRGYDTCLLCKKLANNKAIRTQIPFFGQCIYGIYEAAMPVITEGTVTAVVYVGNAILDEEKAMLRMKRTCAYTGVGIKDLSKEAEACERIESPDELYEIAEIVADYLSLLYSRRPRERADIPWPVSLMKVYADESFCDRITLSELAVTFNKNEKYIGRLFKKVMGLSFNEYCMDLRLKKARSLIVDTDKGILEIAMECGFNSISYFNRSFKEKYGCSPTKCRLRREPR